VNRDSRDLWFVAVAAAICAAVALAVPVTVLRTVAAVPLCLVLPGYALTRAIFARRPITGSQLSVLTLALSLSTLVLGSLVLDLSPGGIRTGTWAALLLVVILAATAVAMLRRRGAEAPPPSPVRLRLRPSDVGLLLVAALIVASALTLSRLPLKASSALGYTQMWMLPSGTQLAPAVRIGVTSAEKTDTTYRLEVVGPSGHATVIDPQLRLAPGGTYTVSVELSGTRSRQSVVEANLYKADSNAVYRRVSAVLPPSTATASSLTG
jgi:Protein of unknown function (DUF1616)